MSTGIKTTIESISTAITAMLTTSGETLDLALAAFSEALLTVFERQTDVLTRRVYDVQEVWDAQLRALHRDLEVIRREQELTARTFAVMQAMLKELSNRPLWSDYQAWKLAERAARQDMSPVAKTTEPAADGD